jgi:hypothetical protein
VCLSPVGASICKVYCHIIILVYLNCPERKLSGGKSDTLEAGIAVLNSMKFLLIDLLTSLNVPVNITTIRGTKYVFNCYSHSRMAFLYYVNGLYWAIVLPIDNSLQYV